MSNKTIVIVNGRSITLRQARAQARAVVARIYGAGYKVGLGVAVNRRAYFGPQREALVVTVRGPKGRLSAPVEFLP